MEQRTVLRLFILKGVNPGDIHTELLSVDGTDVLVLRTVYKSHRRLAPGKPILWKLQSWAEKTDMIFDESNFPLLMHYLFQGLGPVSRTSIAWTFSSN
jgi:hypothetical protein